MTLIYHRDCQYICEEDEARDNFIQWLYQTALGRLILNSMTEPTLSTILTYWDRSRWSHGKVQRYLAKDTTSLDAYVRSDFPTFAHFFTRQYEASHLPTMDQSNVLYAPCQGKLRCIPLSPDADLIIKGQRYTLDTLLQSHSIAHYYYGGVACIYRLSLHDYHRYHYAIQGMVQRYWFIEGKLHSVREVAQRRYPVFKENRRACTWIDSPIGPVIQIEVGALTVGRIHNHHDPIAHPQQEKGYFDLGGSTIIVLFPQNTIQLDSDIQYYSQQDIESYVQLGERIGLIHV